MTLGECVGLVLTLGEGLHPKMGGMPVALKLLTGFARG
jgi:hypothetical protein